MKKKSFKQRVLEGEYQKEILSYLAQGRYYNEIMKNLNLSRSAMNCCVKVLYCKYNATNKVSLVSRAIQSGDIKIKLTEYLLS